MSRLKIKPLERVAATLNRNTGITSAQISARTGMRAPSVSEYLNLLLLEGRAIRRRNGWKTQFEWFAGVEYADHN